MGQIELSFTTIFYSPSSPVRALAQPRDVGCAKIQEAFGPTPVYDGYEIVPVGKLKRLMQGQRLTWLARVVVLCHKVQYFRM